VDRAIAPGWVLSGQSHDQPHRAGRDARTARRLWIGLFPTDKISMPAQQSGGLNEEPSALRQREQPAQTS
jgi:hypothetical protein